MRRRPLLVISVIGVQSSGKSTLMNYLFGCSFATHVGRCTKESWKRAENELWLMIGWSELIQCLSCEFLLVISRTTNQGVHLVNHTTLAFKISSISLKNLKDDDKDLSVPYGQDKMDRTRCCRPTQHVMRCVVMNCGGHFACRASTSLSWKRAMHCWWS